MNKATAGGGSDCQKSRQDDRAMTEVEIKACEKLVIEAYWRTLIERAFRNNADIRFCHWPSPPLAVAKFEGLL